MTGGRVNANRKYVLKEPVRRLNIEFPEALLARIDQARGDQSRWGFIRDACTWWIAEREVPRA